MEIEKSLKFQNEQFGSRGVTLRFDHTDFGLDKPASVDEAYKLYQALSYHGEALLLLEEVKLGRIHPNQIRDRLKAWLPPAMVVDFRRPVT